MDRRSFLYKGFLLTAGGLLNLAMFSKAFAYGAQGGRSFFQPRVALIIDDIGYGKAQTYQFLKMGIPITFSILPHLRNTQLLAHEINHEGHDIMLHQPMEPYNSRLDPGPGALYVGDREKKIGKTITDNISDVPFAIGVNNHMGSRFTECQHEITDALKIIKERDLFFVDSRTSNSSKAYGTARELHMTTARRNVFLDNSLDETKILQQLLLLSQLARRYGTAIAIGHPHKATARAIGDYIRYHKDPDIKLVHISDILYC
jgi:polysaccharide deacetylase 2 family uncharacterized protein YibQ